MARESSSPTIKDVARVAGVSFTTVAKILRGERRFKPETVERVQDAVRALNYRSNRAAAIMGSKPDKSRPRKEGIAYVTIEQKLSAGWQTYRRSAQRRAEDLGFHIETVELTEVGQLKKSLDTLYAKGIDGLILARTRPGIPWENLDLDRFSIVAVGRAEEPVPVSCVRPDVVQAVRFSFSKLALAGCRRIGAAFHHHAPIFLDDRDRVAAYLEAWRHHFPKVLPPGIYHADLEDYSGIDEWLEDERIDGIVAFTSGDYLTLINRGWRIPEDLQLACLTCSPITPPEIAGISEQHPRIHQVAVDLLDQLLRLKVRGLPGWHVDHLMPVSWRNGKSVRS